MTDSQLSFFFFYIPSISVPICRHPPAAATPALWDYPAVPRRAVYEPGQANEFGWPSASSPDSPPAWQSLLSALFNTFSYYWARKKKRKIKPVN